LRGFPSSIQTASSVCNKEKSHENSIESRRDCVGDRLSAGIDTAELCRRRKNCPGSSYLDRGSKGRPKLCRYQQLAQFRSTEHYGFARKSRPSRLLDIWLHQLRQYAAARHEIAITIKASSLSAYIHLSSLLRR